jgi:hypothetical protein
MSSILKAAQRELKRHSMGYFVDNPPSIAQGGSGLVVSGWWVADRIAPTYRSQSEQHDCAWVPHPL